MKRRTLRAAVMAVQAAVRAAVVAMLAALGVAVAVPAAALAASGTTVTVRIEGLKHTLLAPNVIHTHGGWITKYGASKGACPAKSAQGALDTATHHRWVGKWSTQFGPEYEITSILGETHSFSSKFFWEIFADNVAASAGACELKVHRGEQLLFAAVPDSGTAYPLALKAPNSATVGHTFTVKVVYFNGSGKAKPLSGATVSVAGQSAKTNSHGTVPLSLGHAGTFVLHAQRTGYVRAAPQTVHVS